MFSSKNILFVVPYEYPSISSLAPPSQIPVSDPDPLVFKGSGLERWDGTKPGLWTGLDPGLDSKVNPNFFSS